MADACQPGGSLNPLNWFSGNGIICSDTFRASEQADELTGIQSVADNASTYYGADSITAQVAQQAANAQKKAAQNDVNSINDAIAKSPVGKIFGGGCDGGPGVDLSIIGGPCITYSLLEKIGIGAGIVLVLGVILYSLGVVRSFLPRG